MKKISRTIHHGIWLIIAIAVGIGIATLLVNIGKLAYSYSDITTPSQHTTGETPEDFLEDSTNPSSSHEQYYMIGTTADPEVSAKAYLVADIETGDILLSEGRKVTYPIASVTKLVTAIVAKTLSPETTVTKVSKQAIATEGYRGNLQTGEDLSIDDLMYPLLLVSSNDAAEAIAEHFDRETFIKQMNSEARLIGMTNTHFKDPSGLSSENISTADNLFLLLKYLSSQYPEILETTQEKNYRADGHTWETKNKLLDFEPYFEGGKTGYTSQAKQTGVGIFAVPLSGDITRDVAIIILGSDNREDDIAKLIRHTQKYFHYGNQASLKELYPEVKI